MRPIAYPVLLLLVIPAAAHAQPCDEPPCAAGVTDTDDTPSEPWAIRFGGFLQPEYITKEDSPAPNDEDGFRFARARFTATGAGKAAGLELTSYVEAELQPTFSLYDAYVTAHEDLPERGSLAVDLGQTRVPISRQQLISDTRLAFVTKAQLASIAPDRDLGTRVWFVPPYLHQLRVIGSVWNGEGRNQPENINEAFLWAGRVEVTPFGDVQPYAESSFDGNWLSLGASIGHDHLNSVTAKTAAENVLYLGYDISGAWNGLSGTFEYLEVRHSYEGDMANFPGPAYHANGFVAQANYMLPITIPGLPGARVELGARVEEIDRNDAVPITMPGDPNQSERTYTAVASLYLRKHLMKVQLEGSHYQEIENQTAAGANADYPHDQLLLQVTYRVE